MSQNSNFTNIKSIHIEYTLFMSISLSILSLKLSMTMGTLYFEMFIAGALVVGGAIVAHDNHSDYSDYSRHSQYHQYSDAYLVSEIKAKEAELERKKLESERIKEELRIRYFESLQKLKSEEGLENIVEKVEYNTDVAKDTDSFKKKVVDGFIEKLSEEIEEDKRQLESINKAIMKINRLQAANKVKENSNLKNGNPRNKRYQWRR